jgi:uncharacterized membrane protein
MPTRNNTPSKPQPGNSRAREREPDNCRAGPVLPRVCYPTSEPVWAMPKWDDAMTLPPGRGVTVTRLGQALRLAKLTAPLHPILVHFTIALTATAFAFDLLAFLFGVGALGAVGWWVLAAAVLVTVATIATGVKSRLRLPAEEGEVRSFLRVHMALGPIFFGLLVAVGIWRGALWQDGSGVTWWYLAAMAGVTLVMAAQGYLGGELVYRYGAEVKFRYRKLAGDMEPFPRPRISQRAAAEKPARRS